MFVRLCLAMAGVLVVVGVEVSLLAVMGKGAVVGQVAVAARSSVPTRGVVLVLMQCVLVGVSCVMPLALVLFGREVSQCCLLC